ncbi:hypothetical protein LTR99_007276 [Exophiala xenobiotica]|uniref:Uncharacterized protein n=1 Tax=Vermiconidia calcicola TaxID=1690605 RepID=A0AAV9Q5W8_9PEZI|nr:hypothetical protein LTR96_007915 [Exophiala xenobiotica]KAK5534386.1 hypothetical protein LTR25_006418 [Vermiconidia calcicola]KAK5536168.1 hypothetical protein LTR23_008189 [Chaetothyriales sp. CCFEE 6169]KAK5299008.1 hypothetical protein LTR99_007276 [Exophiala xenobiotica]KAK5334695.1 hypothetical protein LTR98_009068 [Exophiala xenobiotica]
MVRKNLFSLTWSAVRKVPRTLGHVVRLALQKVKLQILPQLTKWKAQSEEPKVVIYKNHGIAVLSILAHAVPFAGVMALLVLNINTFFIGNLSTSAVTAFQFAAKLLELLMQASLADILLSAIRWQIVRNQDLPLGGLVAPLRTTDVSYLWSLELWGSLTSKSWRGHRKACLGFLIFATVLLAALVGPSGAVAIVPRQITHHNSQYLNILNPRDDLFPDKTSYLDNGAAFEQGITQMSEWVPGAGPYQLLDTDGIRLFGTPSNLGLPWSTATIPSREMANVLRSQGANLVRDSSSPFNVLAMQTYQALVQGACSENTLYDMEHNQTYLTFPGSDAQVNQLVTWGETLGNVTDNATILFFTNLPSSAPSRSSTLMVLGTTAPVDRSYVATAYACVIDATWTAVTLNASTADSYNQVNYILETHYDGDIPQAQKINFPRAYTDHVRSTILASQTALYFLNNNPSPQQIFALTLSNGDEGYLAYSGLVLERDNDDSNTKALYTYLDKIHAWSRYSAILIDIDDNDALSKPSSLTYQVVSQLLQGYGYDAKDITVQLSLAVLGIFCLFVLAHVFLLLLTGYSGNSWDSISELLMLGLMSRKPDHLGTHVGVGLETLKTFREPVSVKVNDEGHIELVFENDAAGKLGRSGLVAVNKAY